MTWPYDKLLSGFKHFFVCFKLEFIPKIQVCSSSRNPQDSVDVWWEFHLEIVSSIWIYVWQNCFIDLKLGMDCIDAEILIAVLAALGQTLCT